MKSKLCLSRPQLEEAHLCDRDKETVKEFRLYSTSILFDMLEGLQHVTPENLRMKSQLVRTCEMIKFIIDERNELQ